jgi:hypothetical protein
MSHYVRIVGFDENDVEAVMALVREALNDNGVTYPLLTFEIGNDDVVVVDKDGDIVDGDDVVTRYIQLPPLKLILAKATEILRAVSKACPDTMVSLLVSGVAEAALNGKVL